jgi:hypothetical protein
MTIVQKTTHVVEALDNYVDKFKGKPILDALTTALVNRVQDLENIGFELYEDRWLDNAVGTQLDGFGSIVGETRQGRTDNDYRKGIRARTLLNLCQGTPEDIIELLNAVSDGKDIELTEYFPAALTTFVLGATTTLDAILLNSALQSGKPAGVLAHLIYGESPVDDLFQFDLGPGFDQGRWATILPSDADLTLIRERSSGEYLKDRDENILILR